MEVTFKQSVSIVFDYLHTRLHNAECGHYFRLVSVFPPDDGTQKRASLILNLMQVMGICISPKINIISNECFITQKFERTINKRPVITFLFTKAQQ